MQLQLQHRSNGKPLFYYTERLAEGQYNLGKFVHRPELVRASVASMRELHHPALRHRTAAHS